MLTALSLYPKMHLSLRMGTNKYRKVIRKSSICHTQVRADEYSDLCVAVSTVDCFILCQAIGVLFSMWIDAVTDLLVMAL